MSETPKRGLENQKYSNHHKPILVFYISITGVRSEDIEIFMSKVGKKIMPNIDGEAIMIPVDGQTRIECINPVYITNDDLIKTHERLMAELNEHIIYNIEQIKFNNEQTKKENE